MKKIGTMALILGLMAGTASADGLGLEGFGVRTGFRVDPDQFVVGGHANMGEIVESLRFQPMVDIGFGDNLTVLTFNGDFLFMLSEALEMDAAQIYAGGGLAIVYSNFDVGDICEGLTGGVRDLCEASSDNVDDSTTDIALNIIAGVEMDLNEDQAVFGEFRITVEDGSFIGIYGGFNF